MVCVSKHWAGFLVGVVLVALVVEEERFFGGLVVVAVVEERVLGELVVGVGVGGGRGGRSRGVDRMRFLSGGTGWLGGSPWVPILLLLCLLVLFTRTLRLILTRNRFMPRQTLAFYYISW